jgi:hypothetical protein
VVDFAVTATDDHDPTPVVTCEPPAGSAFPIGTTAVSCTARDNVGLTTTATFDVEVAGAAAQLDALQSDVATIPNRLVRTSLARSLGTADVALDSGRMGAACVALTAAAHELRVVPPRLLDPTVADALLADVLRIKNVIGCSR